MKKLISIFIIVLSLSLVGYTYDSDKDNAYKNKYNHRYEHLFNYSCRHT